ncbi:type ISP restriction/modification enzyme [Paracoccus sp. MC1862]|uniref:type ISP restriction/modification enzyme n=1 Tax=Paracoccus sp. MC1862 TaxID=2760307 RepID=UPI0015FFBEE1|nr:type ISP restriction/modification enzyme [Paracoccus sp. MC1862]MBB1499618.1 N-6 DNA methylase [Paracoccus sp. MC1862]
MPTIDHLLRYAQRIRDLCRAHAAVQEPALAPAFQELLTNILAEIPGGAGLIVVPEFANPGVGRPDIALVRPGQPARAFVELKASNKSANPARWRLAHDRRQAERLRELQCWASSNFIDLFLFERADEQGVARIVPERAIDPTTADAMAEQLIRHHDPAPFVALVERLAAGAGQAPVARDARHLAELLAHSSRLVRGIVQDRLAELRAAGTARDSLLDVHAEFQMVLYAHPEAGGYPTRDFDTLFSSAFAQTLAFGLLLVREGSGQPVDEMAYQHMPAEHPLMQTALRVLTQPEILDMVGIGFTVLRDTVNSFAPVILAARPGRPDPILYFYEDFLSVFDPAARERHGVYFTPVEVVRFITGALDRVARDNLGLAGLRDPNLTILDPATGTGTFLLGIAERVRERAQAAGGPGRAELELRDLATRMFGLELLVGPYAVAHYRLHHTLRPPAIPPAPPLPPLPRLGVYLADTLAEPGAAAPAGRLGFVSEPIGDERRAADEVKSRRPILAIIGNPPYRRLEEGEDRTLVGRWMNDLWDDLKVPVRDAGQGNQLNTFPELSVAFWRWSMWKLFEAEGAPGHGVVALITNRKFLTGWPYAGLRQIMRQRFDRIEVIDLRGDLRLGPRAGIERDVGVFNIQVGTAITIAIADGSRAGQDAEVHYLDAWAEGLFARPAKLNWLAGGAEAGRLPNAVPVARGPLDAFRPQPFGNGEWPSLRECFDFAHSGIETKRDALVYHPNRTGLIHRIQDFLASEAAEVRELFNEVGTRTVEAAQAIPLNPQFIRSMAFRPLDVRFHYAHPTYNDRLRPDLQRVWGAENVGLFALPNGTGAGPAVWCHSLLPDRHAFRGSYGGYAFPLHDRRPEVGGANVSQALLDGLTALYGVPVTAEEAFDAILCLLSAQSYTLRFAEDLEDTFPHVPLPADYDTFVRAADLGAEIRAIQTFARAPAAVADPAFVRLATAPNPGATLDAREPDGRHLILCADGSGEVDGLPAQLWAFEVSGYPVLRRWLEGREGQVVDLALFEAFRDVCARIAELIDLCEGADNLLIEALAAPLTRDVLWPEIEVVQEPGE